MIQKFTLSILLLLLASLSSFSQIRRNELIELRRRKIEQEEARIANAKAPTPILGTVENTTEDEIVSTWDNFEEDSSEENEKESERETTENPHIQAQTKTLNIPRLSPIDTTSHLYAHLPSSPEIRKYINYYLGSKMKFTQRAIRRYEQYRPLVEPIFEKYNLPKDLCYLCIIESAANPNALSKAGALGLWQLMPQTAEQYGLSADLFNDERTDPQKSTVAAARYLKYLYDLFEDWNLAIASYNCGQGRVLSLIKKYGNNYGNIKAHLPKETQAYVPSFAAMMWINAFLLNKST